MQINVEEVQRRIELAMQQNSQAIANMWYTKGAVEAYTSLLHPEKNGGLTYVEEVPEEEIGEEDQQAS